MAEAGRLKDPIHHQRDHWKGRFFGGPAAFEVPADVQVDISIAESGMWV